MLTSHLVRRAAALAGGAALLFSAAPAGTALAAVSPAGIIKAGDGPEAIAIDTETGTAWVADNGVGAVTEIAGGKVRATIPLSGMNLLAIAVDSRTDTVWVADGDDSVTEISGRTAEVLGTVTLSQTGAVANAIAVDPVHGEVFVTEISLDNLVEFSESDPSVQHVVGAGDTPLDVAADPATRTAWVTDEASAVTEVSYAGTALTVLHSLPISGGTGAVTVDAATGLVFVSEFTGNAVAIINAASRKVRTVKVGHGPGSVAADPLHGDVWVANDNGNSLSQIRESTGKVVATYPLGFSPERVAVLPDAGVYAVNYQGDSVTFLPAGLRLRGARSASFRTGRHGSVLIAVGAFPAASLSLSGRLPAGLRWSATASAFRIAGTPKRGTEGTYHLTIRATTSWGRHASRRLTITVR